MIVNYFLANKECNEWKERGVCAKIGKEKSKEGVFKK